MPFSVGFAVAKKNLVSVKIDADVYRMVKTVAAWKGLDISDYLTELVRPGVRRDLAKINKEAGKPEAEGHD